MLRKNTVRQWIVGGAFIALASVAPVHAQVKIGMVLPLSGPLANTGNDIVAGTRAFIEGINAAGGIASGPLKGQRIELVIEDDKFDPAQSEEIARRLAKERNVVGLLSCFGTVNCLAITKVAQETATPLIGPIAGAEVLRKASNTKVYALRANASEEVGALIHYLKGIGQDNAAVLVQDDGFGKAYASSLETVAKETGFKPKVTVNFDPKAPNYASMAQALKQANTASVVLIANTQHSVAVIKALNEAQYFGQVLNLAGQANGAFVKNLTGGKQMAVFSVMTPSPFTNGTTTASEYRQIMSKTGGNVSYLSFEAYLNARLLYEALLKTGQNNANALDKAISSLKGVELAGMTINFTGNRRQGANYTDLAVMTVDGKFRQ